MEAQPGQDSQPAGEISGVVVSESTSAPVPDIELAVLSPGAVVPFVRTDASGAFRITGLCAGRYGIQPMPFGEWRGPERLIVLQEGQKAAGIRLRVFRASSISGRVLISKDRPAAGVMVWGLRVQSSQRHLPEKAGGGRTDDMGRYEIQGLSPGRYVLLAESAPLEVVRRDGKEEAQDDLPPPRRTLVSTFYPEAPRPALATPVDVGKEQQIGGMDIFLAREPAFCVRSRISGAGERGRPFALQLAAPFYLGPAVLASGQVSSGEGFEICGLPEGEYTLAAGPTDPAGAPLYAIESFSLANKSVQLPDLSPQPLSAVRGTLRLEEGEEAQLPGPVRLRLEQPGLPAILHARARAEIRQPGSFEFPAVAPAPSWLEARLPDGVFLKSATVQGRDILRQPFLAGAGEIEMVAGTRGPQLTVTAVDEQGQAAPCVAVMAGADPLPVHPAPSDLVGDLCDQNGTATLRGLAPGRYRVAVLASTHMDPGNLLDLFQVWAGRGERVTLAAGEILSLRLRPVDGANPKQP